MAERRSAALRAAEWREPEFAAIAKGLQDSAGLVFPANRRESAEAGMRRAMAAACISDPADLRRAVATPGETRDALITELTIGETFFFREPGQFDFVRTTVLPELRMDPAKRRLRVWSAGCATGEEPYSVAMLLREAAWPGTASIVGTDIAAARLASARRARYTAWSMRGVHDGIISRYFERRGRQFILNADIRRAVDFAVLNLASAEYPSAGSGIGQMDIVFCRNVLIYFDLETIAAIASRLIASLAPGGWLFLGASDPAISELVPCEVVLTGAGIAYRPAGTTPGVTQAPITDPEPWSREFGSPPFEHVEPAHIWLPDEASTAPVAIAPAPSPAPAPDEGLGPLDSYDSAYEQGDYDAAARLAQDAIDRGDPGEREWIILVRSLANRGHLAAAGQACASALDRHRLSPELTHLHGVLLAEGGRHAEAATAARRALYLDPHFTVAHLSLGDALARTGDPIGARRAFANADAQLMRLAPDAVVPGADGAAAAQLLRIARFRLDMLRQAPEARAR